MNNPNINIMSDSECSDTSETSSSDSESSSQSDLADGIPLESTRILKQQIELPKGLCENNNIFNEFFSLDTWNNLPMPIKEHLCRFLPQFSTNSTAENEHEQAITIAKLFSNQIDRFGSSPLIDFQQNLEEGNYRPDIAKLRANIQKSLRREQKFQEYERISRISQSILVSREKLLRAAYDTAPTAALRVDRIIHPTPKLSSTVASLRAKKRYFQEISNIAEGVGLNNTLSDDENYPEGPPAQLSRKQRRHLSGIQGGTTSPGAETRVISTMAPKGGALDHLVGPGGTAALSEEFYRQIISQHKKRKFEEPDHPELDTSDITLNDVHSRTQLTAGQRRPISSTITKSTALSKKLLSTEKLSKIKNETIVSDSTATLGPPLPPLPPPQPQPISPKVISTSLTHPQQFPVMPLSPMPMQQTSPISVLKSNAKLPSSQIINQSSQSRVMILDQNNVHSDSESDDLYAEELNIKNERLTPDIIVAKPLPKQLTEEVKVLPKPIMTKIRRLSTTPPSPIVGKKITAIATLTSSSSFDGNLQPQQPTQQNQFHTIVDASAIQQFIKNEDSGVGSSYVFSADRMSPIMQQPPPPPQQQIKQENNITIFHHNPTNTIDIIMATNDLTNHLQHQHLSHPHQIQPAQINLANYGGTVKAATLSDLEGIDMMHLPVDLDDSGHIDILNEIDVDDDEIDDDYTNHEQIPQIPLQQVQQQSIPLQQTPTKQELMQETDACFLSLIRDIFCSTPNHRTTIDHLQVKVAEWLANPITALNDWYCLSDNWLGLLQSAIHFLSGDFVDQPEDFVPYIEYKQNLQIYQWIGAGRDSDTHLMNLCEYWLLRRSEMGGPTTNVALLGKHRNLDSISSTTNASASKHNKNNSGSGVGNLSVDLDDSSSSMERPISPPPARFPTTWTVLKASDEEIEEFRAQERHRFDRPHKSFTYRMHGYESVVGPVKGIYTEIPALTKARGHNMLNHDRPNFVTILTLVRDATARLPNGEGTRADICELLKSSQFINQSDSDQILQSIVSGALDRMHTEHDPCVRYDAKRKIWIYLHRNRTEEEFERMHQQFQGVSKHKKQSNRKVKKNSTKSVSSSSGSGSSAAIASGGSTTPTKIVAAVVPTTPTIETKVSTIVSTPSPKMVTVVSASPVVAKLVSSSQPPALTTVSITQPPPLLQTQTQQPKLQPAFQPIQQPKLVTATVQPLIPVVVASPLPSPITSMPQLQALSSNTSTAPALIQRSMSQPPLLNKIQPPTLTTKKSVVKPELVPIKHTLSPGDKFIEIIDVDSTMHDTKPSSSMLLNSKSGLPPTLLPTSMPIGIPQQMPSLIVDKKVFSKAATNKAAAAKSLSLIAAATTKPTATFVAKSPNTVGLSSTPIKVSTSSGVQTVFVSAPIAATTTPPSNVFNTVQQRPQTATLIATAASSAVNSSTNQPILVSTQSPLYVSNNANATIMTTAKRIIKPPPLIAQSSPSTTGQHSYIIPISLGPSAVTGVANKTIVATSSIAGATSIIHTNPPASTQLYKSIAMPALTSTSAPRMSLLQQKKLIARAVPAGKSLLSPSVAAANISIQQQQQQQQKLIAVQAPTAASIQVRPVVQSQPQLPQQKFTGITRTPTIAGTTLPQQRQLLKNIITTQPQKRVNNTVNLISNTVVVSAQQQQSIVNTKSVIVSQSSPATSQPITSTGTAFVQKIITGQPTINATVLSPTTPSTPPAGTSLINPQIIQIHQSPPTSSLQQQHQQSFAKVHTVSTATLTPQQQQNFLQSLKQSQLRVQQHVSTGNTTTATLVQPQQNHQQQQQQQSLIIKQQQMLQQIQKQLQQQQLQQVTPTKMTTSGSSCVSLLSANQMPTIITSIATSGCTTNSQLQTVARIIKTSAGTQLIQQHQQPITVLQQTTNTSTVASSPSSSSSSSLASTSSPSSSINVVRTTPESSPIMAKVLTNSSGQIISLESILQKQGIGPGATIRVAGTKPGQTSLIQLAGAPGSQITQYAVVSQGRNLISMAGSGGTTQRLVTTQAVTNIASTVNTTPVGTIKTASTIMHQQQQQQQPVSIQGQPSIGVQQQQQRIIQTSTGGGQQQQQQHLQSISAQQLVNAKVLGVQQLQTTNLPNSTNRMKNSIRMLNTSNLNITHIDGKPMLITGKPQNVGIVQQQQQSQQRTNVVWQTTNQQATNNGTNYVTSSGVSTSSVAAQHQQHPQQTLLFGNQIVKLHPHNQMTNTVGTSVSGGNIIKTASGGPGGGMIFTNSGSGNSISARTVMLGSTGQTIRVQSPVSLQQPSGSGIGSTVSAVGGTQHIVLGQEIKSPAKGTNTIVGSTVTSPRQQPQQQQRVVLAVQGGGQILLPHGFQGGAININSLKGLKMIPIQQQSKASTNDDRPLFAQIITSPQAPRPPNPGGSDS